MSTAAIKLDNELLAALNKLYYTKELKQKAFKTYLNAFT